MGASLLFGALLTGPGGNGPQAGGQGWRSPQSQPDRAFDLGFYTDLAQRLDCAGVDFLFAPDVLSLDEIAVDDHERLKTSTPLYPEPTTLLTALAAPTKDIGLIPTISTTFSEPYDVARRIATLNHLSGGRAGWNAVASRGILESANYGHLVRPAAGARGPRLEEFLEVVHGLWGTWDVDSLTLDKASGEAMRPNLIRQLDHSGKEFRVRGPLNVPSPQGQPPVTVLAGAGADFCTRAARYADVVFTQTPTREAARAMRNDMDRACEKIGRDPVTLLLMPGLNWLVAESRREATLRHHHRYGGAADDCRPGSGHASLIGDADDLASMLEQWEFDDAIDGFIAIPYEVPYDYDVFLECARRQLSTRSGEGALRGRLLRRG
jgi:alkanesulfonate monooxygenase SsuD/methylene tetrahydromethanopterin reductase-like flavin-dependent oxidoreductase (luciferase family)